jgi:ketosteroid isomerase-like protein
MFMNPLTAFVLWTTSASLVIATAACSGRVQSDSRAADQAAIREADAAALRAIAAKQIDAIVSYYDEQASLLMPNAPIVTGKEQIRKTWEQMFTIAGFHFAPTTTKIEVARSGDLAYAQGTYQFSASNPNGGSAHDRGKFVVVWKKQPNATWKIVADIWNSDIPASATKA